MRLVSCLTAFIMLLAVGTAAAGGTRTTTSCSESLRRVSDLEAEGVSCGTARWVARRYDEKLTQSGHWPGDTDSIGRFTCRTRRTGPETYRVRCHRDADEIVRFGWGV
jgi:hypothetical protein